MQSTRDEYHRAIRRVIEDENEIILNQIAECLLESRDEEVWSVIKKIEGQDRRVLSVIDNCRKPDDIADLFSGSYQQFFSSAVSTDKEMESVCTRMNSDLC
jgi:hypothetical protein